MTCQMSTNNWVRRNTIILYSILVFLERRKDYPGTGIWKNLTKDNMNLTDTTY